MRKRYLVVGLLALLSVITFMDRMVLAVTGPEIQRELNIDPIAWGWVLSAYVLAYSAFEIPSGALGDRHGYRRELTRITIWWSFFTLATAFCRNVWQVAAARFLFGAGAAGAYPNMAGVLYRWLPLHERARGQGVIWSASRLGGALLRRGVPASWPTRFLNASMEPGSWPKLIATLETALTRPEDLRAAIAAAQAVFRCFETAATDQECVERV